MSLVSGLDYNFHRKVLTRDCGKYRGERGDRSRRVFPREKWPTSLMYSTLETSVSTRTSLKKFSQKDLSSGSPGRSGAGGLKRVSPGTRRGRWCNIGVRMLIVAKTNHSTCFR